MGSTKRIDFARSVLILLTIFILSSCKIDQDRKADPARFQFSVGDDADLFFRNVRQIYYNRQSPDGKWQAYRLKDRYTGNDRPLLTPVIVIQWLKDEAYLLIENNEPLANEDFLSVVIQSPEASDTLILNTRGRERMLEFGSKIYEAIQEKREMKIKVNGTYQPFMDVPEDRESFRIPMGDFYRLTGVF